MTLLGPVYVPLVVSSAVFLSVSPPLVSVGFGPSEQLLGLTFCFAMTVEKAVVGRARRGGRERDRTGGDQVERGGGRRRRRRGVVFIL